MITEIPYQVSKSRLIEKMAELFKAKKLPLVANLRDESAEDIRIVIEPKSRQVDAEMLMESLFKVTDLQTRFGLNLNVLTSKNVPKVLNLREILQEFVAHRFVVLERRTQYRLGKIASRMEILGGLLVAYLNLDEVIRIIREEDEPKAVMMKRFKITDVQAEAILNMRLRSLRKLEEIEIKREQKELKKEQEYLEMILSSEAEARKVIRGEIKDIQKRFGVETPTGARRTDFAQAPDVREVSIEAFIEKEPITVVYSRMGWIKALKGHFDDLSEVKFKEGDEAACALKARTTDAILFFATNGRFYSLRGADLPGGKGFGEPLRLMIDLPNGEDIIAVFAHEPGRKLLIAGSTGKGFIVEENSVVAQTRGGKSILNPATGRAAICQIVPEGADSVAVIGDNRKLIVFPLEQVPLMSKGQGVTLQKYKGGGLSDLKIFAKAEGLSWNLGNKIRTEADISPWLGNRAGAGKLPPVGFPRSNRFE